MLEESIFNDDPKGGMRRRERTELLSDNTVIGERAQETDKGG